MSYIQYMRQTMIRFFRSRILSIISTVCIAIIVQRSKIFRSNFEVLEYNKSGNLKEIFPKITSTNYSKLFQYLKKKK